MADISTTNLDSLGTHQYVPLTSAQIAAMTTDQLTRVSFLLGIYTALHVLHPGALADDWPRRPNSNALFGGRSPLQALLAGGIPAMLEVRSLLDGRRGGL